MNQHRNLIIVGVAALVGALVAGIWGASQPERYTATTVVAIAPAESVVQDADVIDVVGGLDRGTTVETLAGLAGSASVTSAAAEGAAIAPDEAEQYDVDAVRVVGSNLVDITASGPSAPAVAALSTATAQVAAAQFNTLYRVYRVDVVTNAEVPTSSDRPSTLLLIVAGAAVAGIGAAVILAAGASRRRGRHLEAVRREDDREPIAS